METHALVAVPAGATEALLAALNNQRVDYW